MEGSRAADAPSIRGSLLPLRDLLRRPDAASQALGASELVTATFTSTSEDNDAIAMAILQVPGLVDDLVRVARAHVDRETRNDAMLALRNCVNSDALSPQYLALGGLLDLIVDAIERDPAPEVKHETLMLLSNFGGVLDNKRALFANERVMGAVMTAAESDLVMVAWPAVKCLISFGPGTPDNRNAAAGSARLVSILVRHAASPFAELKTQARSLVPLVESWGVAQATTYASGLRTWSAAGLLMLVQSEDAARAALESCPGLTESLVGLLREPPPPLPEILVFASVSVVAGSGSAVDPRSAGDHPLLVLREEHAYQRAGARLVLAMIAALVPESIAEVPAPHPGEIVVEWESLEKAVVELMV